MYPGGGYGLLVAASVLMALSIVAYAVAAYLCTLDMQNQKKYIDLCRLEPEVTPNAATAADTL